MAIPAIAEHDNAGLRSVTRNVVTAAGKLGAEIQVLVAGHPCEAAMFRVADHGLVGDLFDIPPQLHDAL